MIPNPENHYSKDKSKAYTMFTRTLTKQLLVIYALLTIYTLLSPFAGLPYHPFFTPLLTLLAFTFAILHGSQNLGWKRTLLIARPHLRH